MLLVLLLLRFLRRFLRVSKTFRNMRIRRIEISRFMFTFVWQRRTVELRIDEMIVTRRQRRWRRRGGDCRRRWILSQKTCPLNTQKQKSFNTQKNLHNSMIIVGDENYPRRVASSLVTWGGNSRINGQNTLRTLRFGGTFHWFLRSNESPLICVVRVGKLLPKNPSSKPIKELFIWVTFQSSFFSLSRSASL